MIYDDKLDEKKRKIIFKIKWDITKMEIENLKKKEPKKDSEMVEGIIREIKSVVGENL